MKKKKYVLLACLAFLLASCLFDSDDDGFGNWLSDQGLPNSYNVQTLSIEGLVPTDAKVYRDTTPSLMVSDFVFGYSSKLSHEIALEFIYKPDSTEMDRIKNADSTSAYVSFPLVSDFYKNKNIKDLVFPIKEQLNVNVRWKLSRIESKKMLDSVAKVSDSVWLDGLNSWKSDVVFDSVYAIKVKTADSAAISFGLPKSFFDSVMACSSNCHLEMRLAAPDSKNLYRFYVTKGTFATLLHVDYHYKNDSLEKRKIKKPTFPLIPYRVASVVKNMDCSDCLVLHGGPSLDSMVVEFPAKPILKALSEFYGDEFPYTKGDGFDVRQAVVFAQMTFARDDANSENNLGLPIQVAAGSYLDYKDSPIFRGENYKINRKRVATSGHPYLIFYEGDSLTLQVTEGVRDFINRASDNVKLKMMMRLSLPILQDRDSVYRDTVYKDTVCTKCAMDDKDSIVYDTSFVRLPYYDYARYDFSDMMKKPATLKLWLATKRSDIVVKQEEE